MTHSKLLLLIAILFLSACDNQESSKTIHHPIAFETTDECHVCGMVIMRMAGPKGQAFDTRSHQVRKFCSTSELIFWYLQPENKPNVSEMYIHDMALASWENPDDSYLIPAKEAYFVINSSKKSPMGKTLASFLKIDDAKIFIQQQGGQMITFDEITLETLATQF